MTVVGYFVSRSLMSWKNAYKSLVVSTFLSQSKRFFELVQWFQIQQVRASPSTVIKMYLALGYCFIMCGLTVGPSFGIHPHGSIAFLLPCRQLGLGSRVYHSNWHLQFRPPHHQHWIRSFWITRSIHSYHHGSRSSPHECPTLPSILEIFIGQNRNSSQSVHLEHVLLDF